MKRQREAPNGQRNGLAIIVLQLLPHKAKRHNYGNTESNKVEGYQHQVVPDSALVSRCDSRFHNE